MKLGRLIAAACVLAAAGLFFALASTAHGQVGRIRVTPEQGDFEFAFGGSRLGVSIRDVDSADVTREKLAAPGGAVVDEVRSESPAAKAGLKSGDVVISFDGERVRSARQLERLVAETPAGRTVKVAVMCGGSRVELDITPESPQMAWHDDRVMRVLPKLQREYPRIERELKGRMPTFDFHMEPFEFGKIGRGRLGVSVTDLSEQLASYFGVKSGVLVTDVAENSPAAKAGVRAGDVITQLNGQTLEDPDDLRREVSRVEDGKEATLGVTRDKKPVTLKVQIEPIAKKIERRTRWTL